MRLKKAKSKSSQLAMDLEKINKSLQNHPVTKMAKAIKETGQAVAALKSTEPAAIKRPVGRPKKKTEHDQGEVIYKMANPVKVRDLQPGDRIIYSACECTIHAKTKCLDKSKPYFVMVSIADHPILGGLTLPCLRDDIFYTEIVSKTVAL